MVISHSAVGSVPKTIFWTVSLPPSAPIKEQLTDQLRHATFSARISYASGVNSAPWPLRAFLISSRCLERWRSPSCRRV